MTRDELLAMPDEDLRVLVAEKVMGWHHCGDDEPLRLHTHRGGYITKHGPWQVTHGILGASWFPLTDIAAAWSVVEKMWERGWNVAVCAWPDYEPDKPYRVQIERRGAECRECGHCNTESEEVCAESAPRAICVAALLAVESAHEHPTRT